MIVLAVSAVILLSFMSSLAAYFFYFRKKIDGDTKVYDWGLAGCGLCLCLVCVAVSVWQLSKSKSSSNLGNLSAI